MIAPDFELLDDKMAQLASLLTLVRFLQESHEASVFSNELVHLNLLAINLLRECETLKNEVATYLNSKIN